MKYFFTFFFTLVIIFVVSANFSSSLVYSQTGNLQDQINKQNNAFAADDAANIGSSTDIRIIVARIIKIFLGFVGFLVTTYLVYGGYLYITSAGNTDRTEKGMQIILYAALGVFIVLASYSIAKFVYYIYYESTNNPFENPWSWSDNLQLYQNPDNSNMYNSDPLGNKPIYFDPNQN
ncbi:MAG: hypothetical protein WC070_02580 [Candidatus Magasanikbacteria bacterium]